MNSEDDLFEFDFSQNETSNITSTTSVLNDIFDSTQKQVKANAYTVNMTKKCAINKLFNSEFNYKKFIYPSNEDIIKEMEDTKNPNVNCGKFIVNEKSDENCSQLDSELIRQFDIPMTLPDTGIEIQYENFSNREIEDKPNTNSYFNNDFEVDLDLSITSKENRRENELNDFKIGTRKRKAEPFSEMIENEHIKDENEVFGEIKINKMTCFGFKTGTGKQVSISKLSEQKAIRLFEEIEKNDIIIDQDQLEPPLSNKIKAEPFKERAENEHIGGAKTTKMAYLGFKTGTGKQVSISKLAEQKAMRLFEEIEEKEQSENLNKKACDPSSNTGVKFATNTNNQTPRMKSLIIHEETTFKDQIPAVTVGFATAAGRIIPQSKSAYNQAKKLLNDIEGYSNETSFVPAEFESDLTESIPQSSEIAQPIEILTNSNQSNEKKQLQFENENENPSICEENGKLVGFTTAAGRIIPQSKSAYNQAKQLLDDNERYSNGNSFNLVEFNSDFTETICPSIESDQPIEIAEPIEIIQPIEIQKDSDQSNKNKLLQHENENQSMFVKNRKLIGFKTDTDRIKSIAESAKLAYKRIFELKTKEINTKELKDSKAISGPYSVEDLEQYKSEYYKSSTRTNRIDSRLSKEQILETDLIMREVENMDCSWDRAEMSDSWDNESAIGNGLSNLVQSPIASRSDQRKTHLLSSTPIRRMKPNQFPAHTTASEDNSHITPNPVTNRANASIKLQETTANKDTIEISPNAGRFSRMRRNRSQLFPMRKLFADKSSSCVGDDGGENIDFVACIHVRFCCDQSVVSLEVGDDGVIVPDDEGYIGLPQFIDSFMALPNVDPKLISAEWIKNHYQMILWKLMALDKRYGNYLAVDWLSPHHIMLQLKYRYDKEIDNAKRPALRKICEQDDSASKRLVLVVASIEKIDSDSFKVLVSDGWYCVPAIFDKFLKDQIINKKIKPGTKLVLCNAVWTGCDEPIVLPVDHFPPGCGLKLHGNSTRRARAFAKLGYQSNLKPFPVTLKSLNPNGGIASLLNVVINRIYPLQYMETIFHPNQNIPQRIFRNERAEEFARKQFDQSKENIINTTLEKMTSPASTNKKRHNLGQKKNDKIADLCNGEDIMNWLCNSTDQETALAELSFNQQNMLRTYQENLVSDALQEKCPNRNVVTLLRILVGGCLALDVDSKQVAILTLWKPNDDLMTLLLEGASIKIYCVGVTHGKLDVQFSGTNASIALNSISTTRFERNKEIHENLIAKVYQSRQLFSTANACQFLSNASTACEVDCIGIVIAFSKVNTTSNDSWQHVVLSDPDDMDNGIILIKLWGGLKGNFLTSVIETGNCVKFLNLQFRKSVYSKFNPNSKIPAFECHYSTHTNVVYVSRKWNFHSMKQSISEKLEKCLPAFEIFTNDKYNTLKSISDRTTTPKNKFIKSKVNSLNVSASSSNVSPNIASSTPKRLGLSNKRSLKSINLDRTSQGNETLNSARIEEGIAQTNIVQANNELNYIYVDSLNLDYTIAEIVKARKRNSVANASYVINKKK